MAWPRKSITQNQNVYIAFPDQVYEVLQTGRVKRFGKHGIKFIKRGEEGSIICIGEDLGYCIIIKTIERGN